MRLIGKVSSESGGRKFSTYLKSKGIENNCELALDSGSEQVTCQIWVSDEDRVQEAEEALKLFEEQPLEERFNVAYAEPIPDAPSSRPPGQEGDKPEDVPLSRRLSTPITLFFLSLCIFVYFVNAMQESQLVKETEIKEEALLLTPIQQSLLYDMPTSVEELELTIRSAGKENAAEIDKQIQEMQNAPYWRGFYDFILLKFKGQDPSAANGPLFTKIQQGEFWRIFTPCVLHLNFMHIFFNMIWLWVLGRPVEQRIGPVRTLLLTLIVGVLTNTAQYLMSGPFFLGYSGVVMGLAGFIWMREKIAPWEGYPLHRSTILFLGIFIFAMCGLQLVSFFVQIFSNLPFVLNIANTAHIAGAVIGALLGRLSFFAWRVR
jgi:GlpG protein